MTESNEDATPPTYVENSLLVGIGLLSVGPLVYQFPRWTSGLDPMFVHPSWIEQSPFPLFYHMAAVHPLVWIAALVIVSARIFQNYGWSMAREDN